MSWWRKIFDDPAEAEAINTWAWGEVNRAVFFSDPIGSIMAIGRGEEDARERQARIDGARKWALSLKDKRQRDACLKWVNYRQYRLDEAIKEMRAEMAQRQARAKLDLPKYPNA